MPTIEKSEETTKVPVFFYTVDGAGMLNPTSAKVVQEVARLLAGGACTDKAECHVFVLEEDAREVPQGSVAIYDGRCRNQFSPTGAKESFPSWAAGATWCVAVNSTKQFRGLVYRCSRFVFATFVQRRERADRARPRQTDLPWGPKPLRNRSKNHASDWRHGARARRGSIEDSLSL